MPKDGVLPTTTRQTWCTPITYACKASTSQRLLADTNVASSSDADGSSTESSFKDKAPVISLRRSASQKRPALSCMVCRSWQWGTRWIWKTATSEQASLCLCGHPNMSSMQFVYMQTQSLGRWVLLLSCHLAYLQNLCNESVSWLDTPKVSGGGQVWKLWLVAGLSMQISGVLYNRVTMLYVKSWNARRRHVPRVVGCVRCYGSRRETWFFCFVTHFNTISKALGPWILSLVITDLKTRKLTGFKRETFEELLCTAGISCQYFCRHSFATWRSWLLN